MAIVNGTYVGHEQGRVSPAELIASMQQGIADRQAEQTALADKMDAEWKAFEDQLDAMMHTPEGRESAVQRYRQGLILRNKATGNRMTDEDINALTDQWLKMQLSRRKFLTDMEGLDAQSVKTQTGVATTKAKAETVMARAGGTKAAAKDETKPDYGNPPPSAPAAPAKLAQAAPAFPTLDLPAVYAHGSGGAPGQDLSSPRPAGPVTGSAAFVVYDPVNNALQTFTDYPSASSYARARGLKVASSSDPEIVKLMRGEKADLSAVKAPLSEMDWRKKAQAAEAAVPGRTFLGVPYANGGVVPQTPGGLPMLGGEKETELMIPAAEAIADPAAAVAAAVQRGVPSAQILPTPPGQRDLTGAAPAAPAPSPSALPTVVMKQPAGKKTQSTLAKLAQGAVDSAAALSQTLVRAAQESGAQTEALAGRSTAEVTRATNGLRRRISAELEKNMSGIAKSAAQVAATPEYKKFMKDVDMEFARAFANASPEALAAIGQTNAAKIRSDQRIADKQIAAEDRRFAEQMKYNNRLLYLREEAARSGSSGSETMITAYEAAQNVLDKDPYIKAKLKEGWTMEKIIASYAPARIANQMTLKAIGAPLEKVYEMGKNIFGGPKVIERKPTTQELIAYGRLDPAARVASTKLSGSSYTTGPTQSTRVQAQGQSADEGESADVWTGDPTEFLTAGLGK